ncbi:MAG: FAD-dependent oxidoreductase [Pseudodesulfovibrio sp.]|uniref:Response regulator receiver n=1 Tax=Pseudodesulfovibrio aespoeensis (strain ATCC 700646 / DSM 10631 / Aspo-2) TaxID=643562 RepID=E6VQS2_PSEA9|nr:MULTISPECIES: 4Fe-4S binding protein [Pseudodesulfovibrio]MBU4193324.1 FAD-dependent oxidoreductase [Pseudomonadota bacterium]ADU61799.1 response regulator receiver [Pseudodesulfovibrio aespoeensis Aspo-2]MBU4245118.1 FAD-dependent oxidoreductase [Pseudomonadota bacterium]MBU4379548.1 FAD-dependent oxidoreductase [Pseudomonadota bacterium]MBU4476669.1 FAD-dependent oxidoreductase [Pseudomonadota bacterium]
MRKQYGALVVGAGIGGIRAALDLAVTGHKVALIDRRPNHGGILSQLDHQFPSDHCGMCKMLPLMARDSSSQFCLRKGLFHDNIDIMLSTELVELEGEPGKFFVSLSRKSTLIDPARCVSCGKCSEVCPVRVPSEYNAGLTMRAAVHLPVPHAIPNHYVVDLENCQRCWKCHEACPTGAIDFKFDERKDFHILVADSDPAVAAMIRESLGEQNFPLHFAASGSEAVDMLAEGSEAGGGRIRLTLLGMNLDDMGADRVLTRCRELRPDMPVVLLAEPEQAEQAAELVMQGAREHLTKPLSAKRFVPWLDKLYMRIMSDTVEELEVGAVVLAGGFECYNPVMDPEGGQDVWCYDHPGVLTAVEFERLLSHAGPTGGRLLRPGDNAPVRKIAWIQCVGSRDVQKGADFCSAVCCMFSIKEAVLAKKAAAGDLDATIFYMDMRTTGKGYQRYRNRAEAEDGVRFVRSRPHSVVPAPDGKGLKIEFMTDDGALVEEIYDMVVLAAGARPPRGMDKFALTAGLDLNEWGFVQTQPYAPERTSRVGVFSAGAFGEPKDISESVIQAGAAASAASRIIKIYDVLAGIGGEPEPSYPDVSREPPRTFVAVCASCPTLELAVDLDALSQRLATVHSVCKVVAVGSACTHAGWKDIERGVAEFKPNRVLIGACMPYAYIPRLKELGRAIGLNPALMDVVDIYSPTFDMGRDDDPERPDRTIKAEKEIYAALATAVARLQGADPVPPPTMVDVARSALVVGGGLAGMTASMSIADQGYGVCLVESEEELGGMAMRLHTQLDGTDPRKFMEELIGQVEKHPNIKVFKDSRVVLSRGSAGRFRSAIASPRGVFPLEHGVTILATGGHEAKVYESGLCVHKSVMTHLAMEEGLASGTIDAGALGSVVMIQCWRAPDEDRKYCSRVCCPEMLKNVLTLKERNPNLPIYVFYRDIMTQGFLETYYTKARKAGAIFIRYDSDTRPVVTFEEGRPVVTGRDPVLGAEVRFRPDLLSLSSGLEPNDVEELLEIFGVEIDGDGFYREADFKWRPVDFLKQGLYMCGIAHSPRRMDETIASAKAAAQRALRILNAEKITRETVVAQVRHSLCSLCQACVAACPYGARSLDMDAGRIAVDEILCQGCGACAAVCPNSATILKGFHDGPMMSVIDAALEEPA